MNFSENIRKSLQQLEGQNVLIFGDIGVDEYIQGDVYRISPEAPVPVVDVRSRTEKMGLSANVAANVKSLGGTPTLVSVLGNDRAGETLKNLLSQKGISVDGLVTDPQRPTTAKTRVMSGQHHIVRVDSENRQPVSETTCEQLALKIGDAMKAADVVIIQDYAKGIISQKTCEMVIRQAQTHGKKVLVDPYRSTPLEFYKNADLMTPNRDEAFELGRQIPGFNESDGVDALGDALKSAIASPQMVITLGAEGMKIFNNDDAMAIPTFAKKVFDVTGAGDTVISAFALGLAAGWSLEMSGYFANLAAGVVVGQVGAVACSLEALNSAMDQQHT